MARKIFLTQTDQMIRAVKVFKNALDQNQGKTYLPFLAMKIWGVIPGRKMTQRKFLELSLSEGE